LHHINCKNSPGLGTQFRHFHNLFCPHQWEGPLGRLQVNFTLRSPLEAICIYSYILKCFGGYVYKCQKLMKI